MALPIFMILLCVIIEIGGLVMAYAAVDDAAYAVAHYYAVKPTASDAELTNTAAAGPLDAGGLTIVKTIPSNDTKHSYTHHFPNSVGQEGHSMYSKKVTFDVTYNAEPLTFLGVMMVGQGHGIQIRAKSTCVVDRTDEATGNGWWAS